MLLSYLQLCSRVVRRRVLVDRADNAIDIKQVNSSSIDIHLGRFVLRESLPGKNNIIDFRARDKLTMLREEMDEDRGYILQPGEFLLAESMEIFNLPVDLSCEYKLKSSMARIGLEHLTAGWCDAGWHGSVLTLELKNMCSYHSIRIRPGDAIGQMVFFSHDAVPEDKSYAVRGRYNGDTTVNAIKV